MNTNVYGKVMIRDIIVFSANTVSKFEFKLLKASDSI